MRDGDRAGLALLRGLSAWIGIEIDGTDFTRLGPASTMGPTWQFVMGCRFARTNYATQTLGGSIRVARLALTAPRAQQRPSPRSDRLLSPRAAAPGRTTPCPGPTSTGQWLPRPQ